MRQAEWSTDEQFNFGTPVLTNTEIVGTGDAAYVALQSKVDNSDDIPFTTPGNYTYPSQIEVTAGKALLKSSVQSDNNYTYTTPGNYDYDTNDIEITGGVARLKGSPIAPYAWYHFNSSSGVTLIDSSGNGRDGTLNNMEDGDWISGKLNNALQFDGVNEYVDLGAIGSFERTNTFSVECWVKTGSTSSIAVISNFVKPGGQYRGWEMIILNTGEVRVDIFGNNLNRIVVNSTNPVNDDVWHHIGFTYDGSSTAAGVNIYIDGAQETTSIITDTLGSTIITPANLRIGSRTDNTIYYLGLIDELSIYDQELDLSEIQQKYNSGNGTESAIDNYSIDDPTVETLNGYVFTYELGQFIEASTTPAGTNIKHQISIDDGTTYKWWNGSSWATRTATVDNTPTGLTLVTGTYVSGNLASIQSCDSSTYDIDEVTGVPGFELEIEFNTACGDPIEIETDCYYVGTPSHVVNLDIYNFQTSSWDTLGIIPSTAAVITNYLFTVTGTPSDYVEGTTIRVRFYHITSGVPGHDLSVDCVIARVIPCDAWYYENESNTATEINANLSALGSSGTFRVLSFLHSTDGLFRPELDNIYVAEGISFPIGSWEISANFDIEPTDIFAWLIVTETVIKPTNTNILYQHSENSGSSYNGTWLTAAQLQTELQAISNPEKTRIKFQLSTTDGDVTPEIDNLNITSDAGYELTGSYESEDHVPDDSFNGVYLRNIEYSLTLPDNTTITIEARVSSEIVEDEYTEYNSRDSINKFGRLLQWKATLTTTGLNTPRVNSVIMNYQTILNILTFDGLWYGTA